VLLQLILSCDVGVALSCDNDGDLKVAATFPISDRLRAIPCVRKKLPTVIERKESPYIFRYPAVGCRVVDY